MPPTTKTANPAIDPAIMYGVRSGGGSKLLFSVLLIDLYYQKLTQWLSKIANLEFFQTVYYRTNLYYIKITNYKLVSSRNSPKDSGI